VSARGSWAHTGVRPYQVRARNHRTDYLECGDRDRPAGGVAAVDAVSRVIATAIQSAAPLRFAAHSIFIL
jgi:hypothetical protein